LIVVPVEGLYVVVGVPPSYATRSAATQPWFDLSSYVVAKALPSSLGSLEVLDICAGGGVQSLVAANRGAQRVVALEIDEDAVAVARANVLMNGFGDRIEVRQSDALGALGVGERFDFVICNTPYAPVIAGGDVPGSAEAVGNAVLFRVLETLPEHVHSYSRGLLASWRAPGQSSDTYQMRAVARRLEAAGFSALVYADRAPDTLDGVLGILAADLRQRLGNPPAVVEAILEGVRGLLQRPDSPVDGFYNQLIFFHERMLEADSNEPVVFGLSPPAAASA
jgi:predicted RNA methylase